MLIDFHFAVAKEDSPLNHRVLGDRRLFAIVLFVGSGQNRARLKVRKYVKLRPHCLIDD